MAKDIQLAVGGDPKEIEDAKAVLAGAGFFVFPIPETGLAHPEVTIHGRTFRGIEQIREFANSTKETQ